MKNRILFCLLILSLIGFSQRNYNYFFDLRDAQDSQDYPKAIEYYQKALNYENNVFTSEDFQDFKIEGMKVGDSALNYFDERQLEDGEQGWHNYSYKEYSTSLMPGKGIYDWFLVSYRSDDDKFIIEALVGGMEKIILIVKNVIIN